VFELPDRYPQLREAVEKTALIDTHEHLQRESERLALGDTLDFAYLFHSYLLADLVSAGMLPDDAEEMLLSNLSQDEKWQQVAPFWNYVRCTGYGQAIALTIREVYGVPDLNEHTYQDVTAAIRAHNRPGMQRWLIKEHAGGSEMYLAQFG